MDALMDRLSGLLGRRVVSLRRMAGGDLSVVYELALSDGARAVAKHGNGAAREGAMLRAIAATGVPAPAVLAVDDVWLVMEKLPADGALPAAWDDLAHQLNRLHAPAEEPYGWSHDHSLGSVAMPNRRAEDWPGFWAEHRLRCHIPHLDTGLGVRVGRLADRLGDHVPRSPSASLLHGDLWGGNVLVSGPRVSGLIDPACYFGDREVDAAMLTLFDHPPASFFDALALAPGWRERLPVYRLWPLLVHLRLFGPAYAAAVDADLRRLGA
ncbi:fructosamine kinase family protein [Nitrospirillum sp. BR 11164]|uniref:fructosamine kinase family protein n=1 Tax=Nitrospirillum sp. BR 11164 TaxID=3104324 RepID=UPI002AFFBAAE|nr:fructosamine kinase family protein [Nitrospirillum sp. BR 11164]MEA1648659.1 fructosamine kinase family protein [Nitrospirillum sp. BR 11164]